MRERNFTLAGAEKFRFGFQNQEMDGEIKGEGNSVNFEYRMLDPRLGRWFSIDPKVTAWESPYISMGDSPTLFNDVLGDKIKTEGTWKERRQIQRELRRGARSSSVFRDIQRDLKRDDKTHVIRLGSYTDPESLISHSNMVISGKDAGRSDVQDIMYLDFQEITSEGFIDQKVMSEGIIPTPKQLKTIVMGHELGHMWLSTYGLDKAVEKPLIPSQIQNPNPSLQNGFAMFIKNPKYSVQANMAIMEENRNEARRISETEASNIENMIRSSLNVQLRQTYKIGLSKYLGSEKIPVTESLNVIKSDIIYNGRNDVRKYYNVGAK